MKSNSPSSIDEERKTGKHQVEDQRNAILDAAEALFLQNGLDQTTMVDIANKTGIHKVTLYRYFPDIHPIAFEIAARMLQRIAESTDLRDHSLTLESMKKIALAMVDQFTLLKDAYRYLGMFDHLYGDHYPDENLAAWYQKQLITTLHWGGNLNQELTQDITQSDQVVVILNSIMSFLEKLAAHGELLAKEQGVPLEKQLKIHKEIISIYFDHLGV
jgi:AcrR family transcriptional regulator